MTYNILLIDDYEPTAITLDFILEDIGHNFDYVLNAESALKQLHQKIYDLILVDVNLPDMKGYKLASEIRKVNQSAKIIGFTADVDALSNSEKQAFDIIEQKNLEYDYIKNKLNEWLS